MDEALLQNIVERLKPLDPQKIILFGSRAERRAQKESDVDIFLLIGSRSHRRDYAIEAQRRIIPLMRRHSVPIDIVVSDAQDPFYRHHVEPQGVVLYEKQRP